MTDNTWQIFDLDELTRKVVGEEPRFHEFLRVPTLSCAIYRLPAGARDMQAGNFGFVRDMVPIQEFRDAFKR